VHGFNVQCKSELNQLSLSHESSFITALHGMQTRYNNENSVCLSVRLSVKRVHCDQTDERSVRIFIPYGISFSLVSEKKNGWWVDPLYLKFWVNRPPLERSRRF